MNGDSAATAALFGAAIDARIDGRETRQGRRAREGAEQKATAPDADGRVHHARLLHLTPASQITVRPVRWLWQDRLALGTLALLGGREGVGKSICMYTLGASISRGTLLGVYFGTPRAVIVAATEDSWEHTIVPRLMAAGADLSRIFRVDVTTAQGVEGSLSLPSDLSELVRVINHVQAAVVILDPLLSRLDRALDTHKDAEVRQALEPLVGLAEACHVTVVGLIHVNKSASPDALTTLMASRAFAAVARSVLFVMTDPDDEAVRLLGMPKNNLGRTDLHSLSFRIVGAKVAETAEGDVWTGQLEWLGETSRSIKDALESAAESTGDRTATADAADWLQDFLQAGTQDSANVQQAGRKAGHSKNALQRARKRLAIVSDTRGFPRKAYWTLPTQWARSPGETSSNGSNGSNGPTDAAVDPVGPVGSRLPARARCEARPHPRIRRRHASPRAREV